MDNAQQTRDVVVRLVRDYKVTELFIPAITLDGKASFRNAVGREQKYPGRDLFDEINDAVASTGKTVNISGLFHSNQSLSVPIF
jgi:hypothetical protein